MEIFSKCHRGDCDRRRKSNCSGNESGHEAKRGMINAREKMIFAARTRECGTEFPITKRATKRGDSAHDPEHQQRESGANVRQLEAEAGKNAGADDVGNDDPARGEKTDPARERRHFRGSKLGCGGHGWIDNRIARHNWLEHVTSSFASTS